MLSAETATEFGGIGIIINNAGMFEPAARILDTKPSDWTRNIEVNLFGPLDVLRHAVPFLPKGGVVTNVSSGAAANAPRLSLHRSCIFCVLPKLLT